jgi:hypothetical protein
MGSILSASCPCGFEARNLFVGAGRTDFETSCSMPALCSSCHRLVLCNTLAKRARCGRCKRAVSFYTDASMHGAPKRNSTPVFEWHLDDGDLVLPNSAYRCPACDAMKMRFAFAGSWD